MKDQAETYVKASCWCGKSLTVLVRPEDVRAGLTRSCGKAGCRKPKAEGQ